MVVHYGCQDFFQKRCPRIADAGAPHSDDSGKLEHKPRDEADYLSYIETSRSCHVMVFSFQNVPAHSGHEADQLPAQRIAQDMQGVYQFF